MGVSEDVKEYFYILESNWWDSAINRSTLLSECRDDYIDDDVMSRLLRWRMTTGILHIDHQLIIKLQHWWTTLFPIWFWWISWWNIL